MTPALSDHDFVSLAELTEWQRRLDERGLRATGSPSHQAYVADLARRLPELGVADVRVEALPLSRWTPSAHALTVADDPVPVVSPVAYSGTTGPDGVSGPLSRIPVPGTIGVVDIRLAPLTGAVFDALDWDAPDPPTGTRRRSPDTPYDRIAFSQDVMRTELARFRDGGSVALVLVVDLPAEHIPDAYLLYDGVHRGIPALFVSREQRDCLQSAMHGGASARLLLDAVTEDVETHNVLGLIPGASDELVVLHSHTDGPNGIEDNGPEALLAIAHHLAGRPAADLHRSVLVLLTTGHFAVEQAWGVQDFLRRHADDLVPRIAAVVTAEHLGARPSRIDLERGDAEPYEPICAFASPHRQMIDTVRRALLRAEVTEAGVLRPFVTDSPGPAPHGPGWPADGTPFWQAAGLPTVNLIAGPDYLFNVEPVLDLIDVAALRRQVVALTEATLELGAIPWDRLRERVDTPGPT